MPSKGLSERILFQGRCYELSEKPVNQRFFSLRKDVFQVREESVIGFLRGAVALTELTTVELFGCGEQRPSPAVFMTVFVGWIDKILGNDIATHLQSGNKAVEPAAHFWTSKATGSTQLTGNHTAVQLKSQ